MTSTPAAPPPAPPLRRRPWLPWIAGPALSLGLGLLAGFGVIRSRSPAPAPPAPAPPAPTAARPGLAWLDELIHSGDVAAALALTQSLIGTDPARADASVLYRQGLCLEALGRWREAAAALEPLAGAAAPTVARTAARLARARCLIRQGQYDAAAAALAAVAPSAELHFTAEAAYLRALVASAALRGLPAAGAADLTGLLTAPLPNTILYAVDWAEWPALRGPGFLPMDDAPAPAERARVAWAEALALEPSHPLAARARLELGNLEVRHGRLRQAADWYERALKAEADGPEARAAAYNLGTVRLRRGEFSLARAAFLEAVDRGPRDGTTALAWWWIGRTYLDGGDGRQAVRPFRRAAAGAVAPFAVAGEAAAHLLADDPLAAHAALLHGRRHLFGEPGRPLAAALDALARPAGRRGAADRLDALLDDNVLTPLGPAGVYLLGRGLERCGLGGRMVELYETALPGARGPLAIQMTLAIAEHHAGCGRDAAARPLFLAVAAADAGPGAALAHRRLAEAALAAGRLDECLAHGRQALNGPPEERHAVLHLMGRAYERCEDATRAAQCYRGETPADAK